MTDLLTMGTDLLAQGGFATTRIAVNNRDALAFEDSTVLGFLFVYADSSELLKAWREDSNCAIANYQLGLRRAGQKAWNTYVVLLAEQAADHNDLVALAWIEEDLSGTRKIARSGVKSSSDLRAALLTLLPLQSAPKLDAVDLVAEIRHRTTELPGRAIDAFVSNVEASVVLQVLEQGQ
jgi:hypothetical protein